MLIPVLTEERIASLDGTGTRWRCVASQIIEDHVTRSPGVVVVSAGNVSPLGASNRGESVLAILSADPNTDWMAVFPQTTDDSSAPVQSSERIGNLNGHRFPWRLSAPEFSRSAM